MAKSIIFREYQDSALNAGEYTIRIDQELTASNIHGAGSLRENLVRTLIVQGKRFALDPADVESSYPAPGASGDFTAVMPHLVLNAQTLPWQRSPDGIVRNSSPNYPWLALLVFNESDGIPVAKQMTLKDLYQQRSGLAPWISQATLDDFLEYGEKPGDPVTVIDVDRQTLRNLLPSPADLALLIHARGEEGSDSFQPIVVANRLPKSGERHSVHLVSLMGCFREITADSDTSVVFVGETDTPNNSGDFRLVSLHQWNFYCENTGDFKEQLKALDQDLFRLKAPAGTAPVVALFFGSGFVALPHHLRAGDDTASFYRGPLRAGIPADLPFTLPVESADDLLLYERKGGMFDVSYAAAWTLGRQLALEDKQFALHLYKFKRQQAIQSERAKALGDVATLAVGKQTLSVEEQEAASQEHETFKGKITDWLAQYQTLKNIPFHYLVPQENLLPMESIRFFRIDSNWLRCLQSGALSIGGDLSENNIFPPVPVPDRWGFLLRSRVVSEFPKLRIQGFAENLDGKTETEIAQLNPVPLQPTVEKFTDTLLFVHFKEAIQTVEIFLDPVNLYFGFREETDGTLVKDLKKTTGEEILGNSGDSFGATLLNWRTDRAHGVVDVKAWAAAMNSRLTGGESPLTNAEKQEFRDFTSADFALQMVEGAPKVRFYVKN